MPASANTAIKAVSAKYPSMPPYGSMSPPHATTASAPNARIINNVLSWRHANARFRPMSWSSITICSLLMSCCAMRTIGTIACMQYGDLRMRLINYRKSPVFFSANQSAPASYWNLHVTRRPRPSLALEISSPSPMQFLLWKKQLVIYG